MVIVKHTAPSGEIVIRAVDGVKYTPHASDKPASVLIDDPFNGPWTVTTGSVDVWMYRGYERFVLSTS